MRKPFYKASHKAWYIHDDGKLVKLGKTEDEAMTAWAALKGIEKPAAPVPTGLTLAELVKEWLAWVTTHKSTATLRSYRKYANRWAEYKNKDGAVVCGNLQAANIRGFHVTKFCDECYPVTAGYSDSVRWQAQKVAVVMFRWAKEQGLIDVNPLDGYRKSAKCGVRKAFLREADCLKLLTGCDDADFRDLLIVLWETGARAFELFQAEAKHLNRETRQLVFRKVNGQGDKVKSKEQTTTRTIWLSGKAFEIFARLADKFPAGPLFRNNGSRAYTISGCCRRFAALHRATGIKTTLYEFRHGFAHHHATVKRTDIVTLATLMGHANTKMLAEIYAHAGANNDHMLRAVG